MEYSLGFDAYSQIWRLLYSLFIVLLFFCSSVPSHEDIIIFLKIVLRNHGQVVNISERWSKFPFGASIFVGFCAMVSMVSALGLVSRGYENIDPRAMSCSIAFHQSE